MKSFRKQINPQVSISKVNSVEIETDNSNGKQFLKCEYNRDGDNYRSPFSNKYFPESSADSIYPSADLLQLEQKANDVFQRYAQLYFDTNALTSVYFFDTDYDGFGAAFLIKKGKRLRLSLQVFSMIREFKMDLGTQFMQSQSQLNKRKPDTEFLPLSSSA